MPAPPNPPPAGAPAPPPRPPRDGPRVLIIRPSALGDVARSVPVLATLRRAMPEARIDWLVHEGFADAIRHHPALDGVLPFPRKHFGALWRRPGAARDAAAWAGDLRRRRYDIVFDFQGLARSGLFAWLTRAPRRVGYANARELGWLGYNRRHHVDPRLHAVDRMLALLNAEGHTPVPDMRLHTGADDERWLDHFLAEQGVQGGDSEGGLGGYFTVAPTARWLSKCWPIERYTEATRALLSNGSAGSHALVLASPSEREQVRPLLEALAPTGRVLFPTTTVGQMMAVLRRSRLLLCNDSASLHIAVGFDRPLVAIFGPTDPVLVGPYQRNEAVLRSPAASASSASSFRSARGRDDQGIISKVSVSQVLEHVQSALSSTPCSSPRPARDRSNGASESVVCRPPLSSTPLK